MANDKNNNISFTIPRDSLQKIIGQEDAKRALEISIAGEFSICFYGPEEQGKTSLIRALEKIYAKLYRRQPAMAVTECKFPIKEDHREFEIFAKLDKINFGSIHTGFKGERSSEVEKRIRRKEEFSEITLPSTFWDTLGQRYSRDKLTPKKVFTALRIARIIANLEHSAIITGDHFKEALQLTTFPMKLPKEDKSIEHPE